MQPELPIVMGHRGAPSIAPENTLLGFTACFQAGARWTETDVCLIGDGTPVIFHDSTLDRCTDQSGSVADIDCADLPRINANQAFPEQGFQSIPTLRQALVHFEALGMGINLELKRHDHVAPEALVEAVGNVFKISDFPAGQLMLSSFDFDALRLAREAFPTATLAVIAENLDADVLDVAAELKASAVNLWWETLSFDQVRQARAKGLLVNIWTANQPEKVASMIEWGVTSLMSDCPQLFQAENPVV